LRSAVAIFAAALRSSRQAVVVAQPLERHDRVALPGGTPSLPQSVVPRVSSVSTSVSIGGETRSLDTQLNPDVNLAWGSYAVLFLSVAALLAAFAARREARA
jgi:hypothetical protein